MRKKVFIIFIIFALLCFSLVFADNFDKNAKKSNLLKIASYEIPIGKDFDLCIDLSNIPFNDFKIELSSNVDLDDPLIDDENVDTKTDDSDNLVITVNNNNLNELKLNYSLPEDISVGDSIQFIVTITSIESSSDETPVTLDDSITLTVTEDENANVEDSKNEKDSFNSDSSDVKERSNVDSKLDESSNPSLNNGNAKSESFDVSLNSSSKNSSNSSSDSSKTSSQNMQSTQSTVSSSKSTSSDTQQVTYLGSSNNYLSALSVDGFEFTSSFSKTNSTYFVVVPDNTDSLTINASAEDSSSKISVYGEDDLSSEIDKILVSVTAENGNVRIYRVYVKKE